MPRSSERGILADLGEPDLSILLTRRKSLMANFLSAPEEAMGYLLSADNPDRQNTLRAAIAMSRIFAYLQAARHQVRLIETYEKKIVPKKASYSANMIQAFIHVHLYFICWAAIGRMIEVIRRCSGLEGPNKVWKKYRRALESYSDARDHFEHYEERLPGGKMPGKLGSPGDYGSLHKGSFSLWGYRWDVSKESLKKLETIVTGLDET